MTDDETAERGESPPTGAFRPEPDADEAGVEPYEVFVQWRRGSPHEHAETIDAPSEAMAVMLAKRNVDMRREPVNIWVVPRRDITRTRPEDPTLVPGTDRSYRNVNWYAENRVDAASTASGERTDER